MVWGSKFRQPFKFWSLTIQILIKTKLISFRSRLNVNDSEKISLTVSIEKKHFQKLKTGFTKPYLCMKVSE